MGLSASQACFLTLTSRMSNIEHRQQYLANSKMRLAADQDIAAAKYSEALNNQTLQAEGKDLTIGALTDMGYSVMRTSDKEKATAATKESTMVYSLAKPTAPEIPSSARKTEPTAPVDLNVERQDKINKLIDSLVNTDLTNLINDMNNNSSKILNGTIDTKEVTKKDENGADVKATEEVDYAATYYSSKVDISADAEDVLYKMEKNCTKATTVDMSAARAALKTVVDQFNAAIEKDKKSVQQTLGNRQVTRILPASAQTMADVKTAAEALKTALTTAKQKVAEYFAAAGKDMDKTDAQYEQEKSAYKTNKALWDKYDEDYRKFSEKYEAYLASGKEVVNETPENELYTNCKNSQFLIQGLLNGYLSLVNKEGKMVSLDANKDIITVSDKTDDARAEAEYEAEMKKINMKEKAIDNQMTRLNTEYSALNIELQSVKSIISSHASEDFKMFA